MSRRFNGVFPRTGRSLASGLTVVLAFGLVAAAHAQQSPQRSLAEQLIHDVREGKVKQNNADAGAVLELIVKRNIPITYKTISTLMNTPNAFGPGVACVTCHSSHDVSKSYRGLDLTTCEGIRDGSTEAPASKLFVPGTDPKRDVLVRRLRSNRMPLGQGFHIPKDTPNLLAVNKWITEGAKDDSYFQQKVLPLFRTDNAFGPNTPACTACHNSNQEPPSFHELNMGTYAGIMLGADSVAKGVDKATKIVVPGKPDLSYLWQHLVEDRMPPGISPGENRDHPNTLILTQWIKQGARCD